MGRPRERLFFLLPWEKVFEELMAKFEDGDLSQWPLSPDVLCHIVHLRLVRGPEDLLPNFQICMCVQPL